MSILKTLFEAVKSVVSAIGGTAKLTDVLLKLASDLPRLVIDMVAVFKGDKKAKIDETLLGFDEMTGSDEGAIDIIRNLPPDKEEEATDHLKEFIRIIAYCEAKVPGYYEENTG